AVFEDVVRGPADDGGNPLLLGGVGDQLVVDVPGEVVTVHLVAARVALAPDRRIDGGAEPDAVGFAGHPATVLQVHPGDPAAGFLGGYDGPGGVAGDAGQALQFQQGVQGLAGLPAGARVVRGAVAEGHRADIDGVPQPVIVADLVAVAACGVAGGVQHDLTD